MCILLLGNRNLDTLSKIDDYLRSIKQPANVLWFDEKDIVDKLIINDFIKQDGTANISWEIDTYQLTNSDVKGVINYFDYLEDNLFEDFQEEDRKYAQSEYNSYLLFALSQFKNVLNPPWGGGLSGAYYSLPYQWLLVQQFFNGKMNVPLHYFGLPSNVPLQLCSNLNTIISKNIFDVRYWLTDEVDLTKVNYPVLFYERPSGLPVVLSILMALLHK